MELKKMLEATRNRGSYSNFEVAKLLETILGTVILEKMLAINVSGLLFILVGCKIWGESNEIRVSLGTH